MTGSPTGCAGYFWSRWAVAKAGQTPRTKAESGSAQKTPNAERPTPNVERRERWECDPPTLKLRRGERVIGITRNMSLTAITREVSPSINDCELSFHGRQRIDVAKAIAQHRAYRECLKELGVRIVSLPAEPELPDAVFVEDTAVVFEEIAVIANMGAAS